MGVVVPPRGLLDAPVGTSTMQRVTNPSPGFSPMAVLELMTPEQRLGMFWNLATRQAKPYTAADLEQLKASGNEAYDNAFGWLNMPSPPPRAKGTRK